MRNDRPNEVTDGRSQWATTRPVGATLTWEQYCSRVGVDPHAARAASTTSALALALRRLDAALCPARLPVITTDDTEPGEPTLDLGLKA